MILYIDTIGPRELNKVQSKEGDVIDWKTYSGHFCLQRLWASLIYYVKECWCGNRQHPCFNPFVVANTRKIWCLNQLQI